MKRLLEDKEKAEIVVVESNVSVRFMIVDVLRSMGFHNILPVNDGREALHQLKSADVDWLISPLLLDDEYNLLRILQHITRETGKRRTNVSLLLAGNEEKYCLGRAFELGLMSYHIRSYVREEMLAELQRLFDQMTTNNAQPALTAAEYLRTYLRQRNQHGPRLTMERNLLPLYPGNARLLANLAEAEGLMGHPELAMTLKRQAELINNAPFDDELQERLEAVCEKDDQPQELQNILGINSVVLIDPDNAIQNFVRSTLSELGAAEPQVFAKGSDVLSWLETKPSPDLIIMEWRVPGSSGPLLIQKIREKILNQVPIIVLSSLVRDSDIPLLKEMDVDRTIHKPCDKDALQKSIIWSIQQNRMPTEQRMILGKIHGFLKLGKLEDAERLITPFMADGQTSPLLKVSLEAEYEFTRKNFDTAIRLGVEAVKQGGDILALMNLIGKAMLKLDMFSSALQCFEKAHEISPMNIERLLDMTDAHLGLGQEGEAREKVEEILALDPENSAEAELDCKLALNKGDNQAASEALKGVESMPRIAAYINNRAISLAIAGRFEEGIQLYRRAIQVLPQDWSDIRTTVIYNLALAYARNGDYARSLRTLKNLLAKSQLPIHRKAKALAQHIKASQKNGLQLFNPGEIRRNADHPRRRWDEIAASIEIKRGEIGCYLLYHSEEAPDERLLKLTA